MTADEVESGFFSFSFEAAVETSGAPVTGGESARARMDASVEEEEPEVVDEAGEALSPFEADAEGLLVPAILLPVGLTRPSIAFFSLCRSTLPATPSNLVSLLFSSLSPFC